MYFEDLTPYQYSTRHTGENVLNIGWLDQGHSFLVGVADSAFHDALFAICATFVNATRGIHTCPFCPAVKPVPNRLTTLPHSSVVRNGVTLWLGHAEIRVPGENGIVYAAPTMVLHYVLAHDYLPPKPFIDAVLKKARPRQFLFWGGVK